MSLLRFQFQLKCLIANVFDQAIILCTEMKGAIIVCLLFRDVRKDLFKARISHLCVRQKRAANIYLVTVFASQI